MPKWEGVLDRIDREPDTVLFPFEIATSDPLPAIPVVNNIVNSYEFISDQEDDYWRSPGEFFNKGGGDCEDFAIAKYVWLRKLGMPENKMQIAIVNDRLMNEAHALLLVDTGTGRSMILDNQNTQTDATLLAQRYDPIFSFNREGVWVY